MKRGCYFEFASVYSGEYDLLLGYLDDDFSVQDSGGKYKLITSEQFFNGEKYLYANECDEVLNFNIEMFRQNDEVIPETQLLQIKQWLFNQPTQWCKLKVYDTSEIASDIVYFCQLIPVEDIRDIQGYKGIRCSVQCNSPFGYKEVVTKSIAKTTSLQSDKKAMSLTIDCDIATQDTLPMVKIYTNKSTEYIYHNQGIIINKTNGTSMVIHNIQGSSTSNNITTVNCQSGVITNTLNQEQWLILGLKSFNADDGIAYTINSGLLKLDKGKNDLVFYGLAYKIEVLYRPTVRVGAF